MKTHALFQYIFDIPVYPSKVLVALYISPVCTAREISEHTGISRGKVYQTVQFLEDMGYVDRSERGIVKLRTNVIESKFREGIEELSRMADDLTALKRKAIKEKKEEVLKQLRKIEELEKTLGEEE